jgi:Diacylglycerol acyltransferase
MLRLPVWKYAASFYPAKIVKTAELDPDGNYIFCAHPHGIFCSSLFLAFATEAMDFSKLYPGQKALGCLLMSPDGSGIQSRNCTGLRLSCRARWQYYICSVHRPFACSC